MQKPAFQLANGSNSLPWRRIKSEVLIASKF